MTEDKNVMTDDQIVTEPYRKAIKDCKENGILNELFEKIGEDELINMLLREEYLNIITDLLSKDMTLEEIEEHAGIPAEEIRQLAANGYLYGCILRQK